MRSLLPSGYDFLCLLLACQGQITYAQNGQKSCQNAPMGKTAVASVVPVSVKKRDKNYWHVFLFSHHFFLKYI